MASGEMTDTEFTAFLKLVLRKYGGRQRSGCGAFYLHGLRHFPEVLSAGRDIYDALLNVCVWAKGNGGMRSLSHPDLSERSRGG